MLKPILLKCLLFIIIAPVIAQESTPIKTIPIFEVFRKAKELVKSFQYTEALQIIENTRNGLGAQSPSNYMTYAGLADLEGQAYYGLGELSKAITAFEETLNLKRKFFRGEHYTMTGNYGNIGTLLMEMQRYKEALPYFEKMLEVNEEIILLPKASKEHEAHAYRKIGDYHQYMNDNESALQYYKKSYEVIEKHLSDELDWVANISSRLSSIYRKMGDLSQAFSYAEKAVRILKDKPEFEKKYTLALHTLANYYKEIADYERENLYLQQSVAIYRKLQGDNDYFLYRPYNALGLNSTNREEYDEAIKYFQLATTLFLEKANAQRSDLITLHTNLAIAYSMKGDLERSKTLNLEAIDLANALPDSIKIDDYYTLSIRHNLAKNYMASGQPVVAADLLNQSSEMALRRYGRVHSATAIIFANKGRNLSRMGRFDEAEKAFKTSLQALNYNKDRNLTVVNSLSTLVENLAGTGELFRQWYLQNGDESKLRIALDYFTQAQTALSFYARGFNPISKFAFAKMTRWVYEGILQNRLHLYELTDSLHHKHAAFAAAESTRSSLLYNAMQASEALSTTDVNPDILKHEKELRMKMTYLEKQKYGETGLGKVMDDSTLQVVSKKLIHLNDEYQSLQKHLEDNYPNYFQAKYGQQIVPVEVIQKELLAPDQTLVEYLLMDSAIYIFIIQKQDFRIVQVPHQGEVKGLVESMTKDGIYSYHGVSKGHRNNLLEEQSIINYTEAAVKLYQKLWAPIKDLVTERVVIIPDQVLAYLPFETFLEKEPVRYGKIPLYDFLLKKHSISYGYSAALLLKMTRKNHGNTPTKPFFGMAPFSDMETGVAQEEVSQDVFRLYRDSLGTLVNSGREVLEINQLFKGDTWLGINGTMSRFMNQAENYKILHLSTHGKANQRSGDFAFLAFKQEEYFDKFVKLYAKDIYNLNLRAELVVLSACETGLGRLRYGEGVISLARAFTYAGAKGIVNTLWAVDDESTATIMINFYKQLINGIPKDIALRNAKLNYLQQEKIKSQKLAPFFWAPSILIGDVSALE